MLCPNTVFKDNRWDAAATILTDERCCGWYVQNYDGTPSPKIFPIPIGFDLHTKGKPQMAWYVELRGSPQPDRKLAILIDSMRLGVKGPWSRGADGRKLAVDTTARCQKHERSPHLSVKDVQREYRKYAFGLSPKGNGVDCHRTWEMLYFGMIPITLHSSIDSLYDGLPVVLLDRWADICDLDLHATLTRLGPLLPVREEMFTVDHWFGRYRPNHTCTVRVTTP